ncbi:hypothetical protein EDF56_102525 [Novosphingobium sp. PhB165]|uniref:hypothetical protein n=1 Tax=Novosphingobium sp. PhB165 TaxID=2485105 RepID=UPI0010F121B8|nr:hypothetical protein [Novosphingobium sp. PhB165]TCM20862.1 hypothetical protein EDF56_102525 [Novosphingobium sp. PhB165]
MAGGDDFGMAPRQHRSLARVLARLGAGSLLVFPASLAWAQAAPAPGTQPVTATTDGPADTSADTTADGAAPQPKKESKFHRMFFDEKDGKFDFSNTLAKGGFLPMPVIITEPAVDGGFGLIAQFIKLPKDSKSGITRTMVGAVKTGNGSYGYGFFRSGSLWDGEVSYKFGVGRGKINLNIYPSFLPQGIEYTNRYDYGAVGSVRLHLADRRFSFGPVFDFRQLHSKLDFQQDPDGPKLPDNFTPDFDRKLNTGALGFGVHFDSRNNALSPTEGVNIYAEGKFNAGAFGSDRDFQIYQLHGYGFHQLSPAWDVGAKLEIDAARDNYPAFFAPAINIRGVEASRYQGATVYSSEIEVTRRLSDRWSILGFAGLGFTDAGGKRTFDNSGAIFAGGGGFRYRIARKLGLDAGVDVAYGPGGAVFYLQFGHAWSFGLD